jgi:hypothetical protein
VWGRGLYELSCWVLDPGFFTRVPDFGDFVLFWVGQPREFCWPHLSSVAVQATGYDSKLKFTFDVLISNCTFDGVLFILGVWPAGSLFRVELLTRGVGPAVSRALV